MIRTSSDPEADAMFVWFGPEGVKSASTEEVSPGIMLDFDNEGRVIGIEGARPERAHGAAESCRLSGAGSKVEEVNVGVRATIVRSPSDKT